MGTSTDSRTILSTQTRLKSLVISHILLLSLYFFPQYLYLHYQVIYTFLGDLSYRAIIYLLCGFELISYSLTISKNCNNRKMKTALFFQSNFCIFYEFYFIVFFILFFLGIISALTGIVYAYLVSIICLWIEYKASIFVKALLICGIMAIAFQPFIIFPIILILFIV